MAFAQTLDPTQQNQPGQPGMPNPLTQQAPITTSSAPGAGPAAPGSSATGAPSAQAPAQPFVNLQSYLTANAPQIAQEGQTLAGQLNTGYGQIQSDVNKGASDFASQVASGYAAPNADLNAAVAANPAGVAADANAVKDFQAQLNDQYKGPANIETTPGYLTLNQEIENAAKSSDFSNPANLQTYFQSIEPNPTAGNTMLDTVLLGGDPNAMTAVKGAAAPYATLPSYLTQTAQTANQGVTAAQQAAQDAANAAKGTISTTDAAFNKAVQDELAKAQGAFTGYNADVGQLQSSAADINTAIQQFLAANPNIQLGPQGDFLAPWTSLQPMTTAPTANTAAGAQDFAEQAALAALAGGAVPTSSPLDLTQAGQAGTFALPQDLQAAIQNQSVPTAMRNELGTISGDITGAYAPFQTAQNTISQDNATIASNNQQIAQLSASLPTDVLSGINSGQNAQMVISTYNSKNPQTPLTDAQVAATTNVAALTQQNMSLSQDTSAQQGTIQKIAPGLQWLPQASTQYNDLVARLSADMTGLGGMNVPTYAPPAPAPTAKQAANAAGAAIGVGTPAATAAGLTAASALPAAAVPTTASELAASGLSVAGEVPGAMAGPLPAGGLSPLASVGPSALAAYGTSNIAQNTIANPTTAALADLANTGISLATLSLPPAVLSSIGTGITNVMNSIGSFFGGLF